MKFKKLIFMLMIFVSALCGYQFINNAAIANAGVANSSYQMIAHGYDWGPAIDKVVIKVDRPIKGNNLNTDTFKVSSSNTYIESTPREVTKAYLSDAKGNSTKATSSRYITLDLKVGPTITVADPLYFHNDLKQANIPVEVHFKITQENPLTTEKNQSITNIDPSQGKSDVYYPEADKFSKNYDFTYQDKHFGTQKLSYTYYQAPSNNKRPLIIWLHGLGEGGEQPMPVSLFGNKVVALTQNKIQSHFGANGADVLVPQARTYWLDTRTTDYSNRDSYVADGVENILSEDSTSKDALTQHSRYEDALTSLIQSYLTSHPNVDRSRIYLGGCSNGGYMALRMLVKDPSKYTAVFPICEAYLDKNITDEQLDGIKDSSIWFTQAQNDPVVDPQTSTVPTYKRLIKNGAKDVHFSFPVDVHDQTGLYKGDDGQPYQYLGHYSWINVLDDYPAKDFDGSQSQTNGQDTTVMSWLASHTKDTSWK